MGKSLLLLAVAAVSYAAPPAHKDATPTWLDLVAPVITPAEKKAYLALSQADRAKFEDEYWAHKAISAQEYRERLAYIDAQFGSTKPGSGANTDQGRVYLSLGAPDKITRLPSSRIFQPVEIWYYSVVPGVLNTEVHLMFFRKNGVGYMKLYSPVRDTIRALLVPQASTVHMFGPNDDLNEEQIRNNLQVPPGEDEIVSASVNVAAGVRYEENDTIIGKVSSPTYMIGIPPSTEVTSRLITSRPKLDIFQTVSAFGGAQVDLKLEAPAQREIDFEVSEGDVSIYQNHLNLGFSEAKPVRYTHRLDLLPGSYRLIVTVDGKASPYSIDVPRETKMGQLQRAIPVSDVSGRETPFEFDGRQLELNPAGAFAVVALPHPGKVTWIIRRGGAVLWRAYSDGHQIASVALPANGIEPGLCKIEALLADTSTIGDVVLGKEDNPSTATLVSFNANLSPARRFSFIGHQWLLRNNLDEARRSLDASLAKGITDEARVELARVDALGGNLDAGRDLAESVLRLQPNNFEALTVLAYIEARFQDYPVAAQLYRRALAVQESPDVRAALAKLPVQ